MLPILTISSPKRRGVRSAAACADGLGARQASLRAGRRAALHVEQRLGSAAAWDHHRRPHLARRYWAPHRRAVGGARRARDNGACKEGWRGQLCSPNGWAEVRDSALTRRGAGGTRHRRQRNDAGDDTRRRRSSAGAGWERSPPRRRRRRAGQRARREFYATPLVRAVGLARRDESGRRNRGRATASEQH